MTRRSWVALLIILLSAGVIVFVTLTVSDSASGKPDLPACKAAMRAQFQYGMEHPDAPEGARPVECRGVSDRDLQRFFSEIMNDYTNGNS
jgi:hypothetical protein